MPHVHDKIDFCAEVFIVHKNKVLLRVHDKFKFWLSIGGHIELDEDPNQAAIREVKEEVGLDITIVGHSTGPDSGGEGNRKYAYLIPPRYMGRHPVNDAHEHIALVYFATANTDVIVESINEHERAETKWFSMEDLENTELVPNIKYYAVEAIKALGEK